MLKELIKDGKTTYEEVETAIRNMKKIIDENKVKIAELETMHFNDQAEIVRLRRMVEALEEQT